MRIALLPLDRYTSASRVLAMASSKNNNEMDSHIPDVMSETAVDSCVMAVAAVVTEAGYGHIYGLRGA